MSPILSLTSQTIISSFCTWTFWKQLLVCQQFQHREARSDLIRLGCTETICTILLKLQPELLRTFECQSEYRTTPRNLGYWSITSFSTSSSGATDENDRATWTLPAWLKLPARQQACSRAVQLWLTEDWEHVCGVKTSTNKRQWTAIWKTRENKTTFANIPTTVLFGDIALQFFFFSFFHIHLAHGCNLDTIQFPVPPTTASAYQESPGQWSLPQPSSHPGETDPFLLCACTSLWTHLNHAPLQFW